MPPDSITIHGKTHALNFTYKQLVDKVNGEKNVGELRFGSDGKLHRVNNHVTFTSWNKTVLTGEENYKARKVISELIDSHWANDFSSVRGELRDEARRLLLGDDVAHAPVSRDEVRIILSMLKSGDVSAKAMFDAVMFVRHIKKTGEQNVAALLEQGGFSEDAVSYFVKGWDLSPVARNRSDNFTHWAEKANALEMDVLLSKLKADGTARNTRMEAFRCDFTRMLVETLREVGVEVNQSGDNGPKAYKKDLENALKKVSRMRGENTVSLVKTKLRERMLQNVEEKLLGSKERLILDFQSALLKMQKDVASAVQRLWTSIPVKSNLDFSAITFLLADCGVETAKSQKKFIDVTIRRLDGRTEQMQVEDTPENREKFVPGKEPNGAGQGLVRSVRYMAKVRTKPVISDVDVQAKEQDISQDELFEMQDLGAPGDLYTVAPKADSLRKQYVERIKGKLAGVFDDIFDGTDSLSKGCRKLLGERADLFTLAAINRLAERETLSIRDRDIRILTGALSQFVKTYDDRKYADMEMSFQDVLDTYRCLEGPADDLSVEDFSRRLDMRNKINHLSEILSNGRKDIFDGLGLGFPSDLPEKMGLSTFFLMTPWLTDDFSKYKKIVKMSCFVAQKAYGQSTVDAVALNLLKTYKMSDRDLAKLLSKSQEDAGSKNDKTAFEFDVLGALGQVVDAIVTPKEKKDIHTFQIGGPLGQSVDATVTSKEKKEERQDMSQIQDFQLNEAAAHNRKDRCQRVREMIVSVLSEMGYELKKVEEENGTVKLDAEGNAILKLAQGKRILELPEDQQPAKVRVVK